VVNLDSTSTIPQDFQELGTLKTEYEIKLKSDAKPYAFSTACQIPIQDKGEHELKQMETTGVISKVSHSTDWCAGICSMKVFTRYMNNVMS